MKHISCECHTKLTHHGLYDYVFLLHILVQKFLSYDVLHPKLGQKTTFTPILLVTQQRWPSLGPAQGDVYTLSVPIEIRAYHTSCVCGLIHGI